MTESGAARFRPLRLLLLPVTILALGITAGSVFAGAPPHAPQTGSKGMQAAAPRVRYLYNASAPSSAVLQPSTDGTGKDGSGNAPGGGTATPTATPCVPGNPTWTPVPTMPPPARYNAYGAVGADGRFYIPGGLMQNPTPVPDFYAFNPAANSWTTLSPLPTPRSNSAVGALGGKIHVAGGFLGPVPSPTPRLVTAHHVYDIANNTWTQAAPMPTALASAMGWGFSGNNRFYVFGGSQENFVYSLSTYIYDPTTDTWTTGAPLPDYKEAGGIAEWGGKIYIFGGRDELGVVVDSLYEYNPVTNSWAVLAPAPVTRYWPGMSARTGKLYVTGGGPNDGNPYAPTNQVYTYDIATNTWSSGPNLRIERTAHAQGTLSDGRIIVAGGVSTALFNTQSAEVLPLTAACPQTATPTRTATGVATATVTPCPMSFSDVATTDWFHEFVRCLYCRGAISGYSDGTFRPYNQTTRSQMTKIVVVAFSYPIYTPPAPTFSDVSADNPFYQYVETAVYNGIVSGYSDGTFRPYNDVTRGQLSKIVVVAAGWALVDPQSPTFSDVPRGTPFYQYVETAYCHDIITGYTDGTFRPGNNATRAQISKIVCLAVRDEGVC